MSKVHTFLSQCNKNFTPAKVGNLGKKVTFIQKPAATLAVLTHESRCEIISHIYERETEYTNSRRDELLYGLYCYIRVEADY